MNEILAGHALASLLTHSGFFLLLRCSSLPFPHTHLTHSRHSINIDWMVSASRLILFARLSAFHLSICLFILTSEQVLLKQPILYVPGPHYPLSPDLGHPLSPLPYLFYSCFITHVDVCLCLLRLQNQWCSPLRISWTNIQNGPYFESTIELLSISDISRGCHVSYLVIQTLRF